MQIQLLLSTGIIVQLDIKAILYGQENVIHIISFEPISKKATSKSSHETSMKSEDVIGTFWQATTKELYHVT